MSLDQVVLVIGAITNSDYDISYASSLRFFLDTGYGPLSNCKHGTLETVRPEIRGRARNFFNDLAPVYQ